MIAQRFVLVWLSAGLVFLLTLLFSWRDLPFNVSGYQVTMDRVYYVKIAQGHMEEVIKPFSKRVLHPKTASVLSHFLQIDLEKAFYLLSLLSLGVLTALVCLLLRAKAPGFPPFLLLPLLVSPYLCLGFYDYYMHDLFFSAVLVLFFFFLSRDWFWAAVVLIIPLFLIREATVLLCMLFLGMSLLRKKYAVCLGVLVATFVGMKLSAHFSSFGGPNRHELGELPFMFLKVAYNSLSNILGINLWVTGYTNCVPEHPWVVPSWFPSGHIREFAVCDFRILQPLHTLYRYLTTFGVMPFFVFGLVFKHRRFLWRQGEFWLVLALVYGLISYLLGPALGPGGFRLIGYGWPAFWLAGPVLIWRGLKSQNRSTIGWLVLCHILLVWEGWVIEQKLVSSVLYPVVTGLALILTVWAGIVSRRLEWKKTISLT